MSAERDWIKPKHNAAITHAWMSRDPQRLPTRFRSFEFILKYVKLYCQYSSLNGFKYLADSQRTWFERMLWIVIHSVTISSLIFIVYNSYQDFLMSPTVTSMDSDHFPTTELNFPGVAICSINRISLQSATEMATEILKANVTDLPIDEILMLIMQLGNLYASEFNMDRDRNVELNQLLMRYYKGNYDIGNIMKRLSPQCSIMLLVCKLHGSIRNCSQIFTLRKTQDGFCCTFNYAREDDDIPTMSVVSEPIEVHKVFDLGVERGLTVVMEPFLEDYFYPILPVVGWKVTLFDPHDYPDVSSGGVTEVLAMPRTETYMDVTATSFFSTSYVEHFSTEKRKCVFSKDRRTMYGGTSYTYSDCIVDCKAHDIQKICGCRPFFYTRRGVSEYSLRVCTTTDLECLSKYKSKWWTVFPDKSSEKTITDNNWALHCKDCYPSCEDIKYYVLSSKSYMQSGQYKTDLLRDFNVTNQAMVHIFFSQYGSIRLKQDVASRWYELMSDIGGICGVFIGFSLISVVELVYFVAIALRDLFCKGSAIEVDGTDGGHEDEAPSETVWTIYWSELMPRSWQSVKYGQPPSNRDRY